MKNSMRTDQNKSKPIRPPARTQEERESQMVALATDLAEKQLLAGTASSQVITHYLKRGSLKEEVERETLKLQQELIRAKTDAINASRRSEELVAEAITAFRVYSGGWNREDVDE